MATLFTKIILYIASYLAVVYGVVWYLVIHLERVEAKMLGAVDFYYKIWGVFYLPVAIYAVIILLGSDLAFKVLILRSLFSVSLIGVAVFLSFYLDVHWVLLMGQYLFFGLVFPLIFSSKLSPFKYKNVDSVKSVQ